MILPLNPNLPFSTAIGSFGVIAVVFGAIACLNQNVLVGWPSAIIGVLLIIFVIRQYHRYYDAHPAGEGVPSKRSAPMLLVMTVNLSLFADLYSLAHGELRNFAILYPIAMIALVIYFDLAWLRDKKRVEN